MTELLEVAARVAGWARDGEDVEVYVSRGTETEVRAYEGEVESLSSATSAGAGVRVVRGGRQGFAYAGSLDEEVLAETLAEARDNATFSSAEAWVGLPEPDGEQAADGPGTENRDRGHDAASIVTRVRRRRPGPGTSLCPVISVQPLRRRAALPRII